ncbi:MAG: hypothetical protein V1773_13895 [bacterium]
MKALMYLLLLIFFVSNIDIFAQTWVDGYYKKDGTYVSGYLKSNSNETKIDNYSTKGNINPFSLETGTKDPYKTSSTSSNDIFKNNNSNWNIDVKVNDYTKSDGTQVDSYYKTKSNNLLDDNFSTKGNYNPYTKKLGTKKVK